MAKKENYFLNKKVRDARRNHWNNQIKDLKIQEWLNRQAWDREKGDFIHNPPILGGFKRQ